MLLLNFEAGRSCKEVNNPMAAALPLMGDPTAPLLAWALAPQTPPPNLTPCVHPEPACIKTHDGRHDASCITLALPRCGL
ncbi:hypothetical protein BC834DRAFT_472425 [Gloeopeniophorella convolvens]|nr:hypothetical protein BC834DRAFT_472425 [Gloeopeniophorella convolvens]